MERLILIQLPFLTRNIQIHLPILRRAGDLLALQPLHANLVAAPDQVGDAVPRDLGLRTRRVSNSVHVAAQDPTGPFDKGVAQVDNGAVGLGPDVFPGGLVGGVAAWR